MRTGYRVKGSVAGAALLVLLFLASAEGREWMRCAALTAEGFPSNNIAALAVSETHIWVGTDRGLVWSPNRGREWRVADLSEAAAYWTTPKSERVAQQLRALRRTITAIAAARDTVWVGTLGGLCMSADGERWFVLGATMGLPVAAVWDVAVREKEIWVATSVGLYRSADGGSSWTLMTPVTDKEVSTLVAFRPRFVALTARAAYVAGFELGDPYGAPEELYRITEGGRVWERLTFWSESRWRGPVPRAVRLRAFDRRIWVCTLQGIVFSTDEGKTWNYRGSANGLPSEEVYDALEGYRTVWLATGSGLCWTTDEGDSWQTDPVFGGRVDHLASERTALWLGTRGGLLRRAAGGRQWESFSSRADVRAIAVQGIGSRRLWWVGTTGGLSRSEDGGQTWRHFSVSDGMPSNFVSALLVQGSTLWVATDGGIWQVEGGGESQRVHRAEAGLLSSRISDLALSGGDVWAATDRGLSQFNRALGRWQKWMVYLDWERVAATEGAIYATTQSWVRQGHAPSPLNTLRTPQRPFTYLLRSTDGGNTWTPISVDGYTGGEVFDLKAWGGVIWLATASGLYRSTDRGQTWCVYEAETLWGMAATCVVPSPDGRVFVQAVLADVPAPYGLWSVYGGPGARWFTLRPRLPSVARVAALDGDTLLAGNAEGLFVLRNVENALAAGRPGRLEFLRMAYLAALATTQPPRRVVSTIDPYAFHCPTIWLGTEGSGAWERGFPPVEAVFTAESEKRLTSRDPYRHVPAYPDQGPAGNWIRAILPTPQAVWFATDRGASAYDRLATWRHLVPPVPEGDRATEEVRMGVTAIAAVDEELWFGTVNGISIWHPGQNTWRFWHAGNSPLAPGPVTALASDEVAVWIGTLGGAYRLNRAGEWRLLTSAAVTDIALAQHLACVGTDQGLYFFEPNSGNLIQRLDMHNSKLLANRIDAVILEGNDIWAAAGGALVKVSGVREAGATTYAAEPSLLGPAGVLVVVNAADDGSVRVGEYYARARGIPQTNICRIHCSTQETISRAEYEERIRRPVWEYLYQNGLDRRISFIVTTYGVPLRIAAEEHPPRHERDFSSDMAAVDSELCLLARTHLTRGPIPNRYLYREERFDSTRFGFYLVCRLDGSSPEVAIGLVDSALSAERNKGFGARGWATFDLNPPHNSENGYLDNAILSNYHYLNRQERHGGRLRLEATERPLNQPGEAADTFFYMGWDGDKYEAATFSWTEGAIGIHFAPQSASSLRDPAACWLAGALRDGLACGMGTVYPPAPEALNAINNLYRYLQSGFTWAESAYMSIRFLSWQHVVVGDPLYRPLP